MKKFGKLMLSTMLACSLFGCTQKAGGAKDGEFSASEKGFGGDIKVTLKVSGGKLKM